MEHLTWVEYMASNRNPSEKEKQIISYLVAKAHYEKAYWDIDLKVADMLDGMGSLLLIPKGLLNKKRLFKSQISEVFFKDVDGIDIVVSLNVDQDDFLFELDIWKMNYGNIISFENLFKIIEDS